MQVACVGARSSTGSSPMTRRAVPFTPEVLASLYPNRDAYLKAFAQATKRAVATRVILKDDVPDTINEANRECRWLVTSEHASATNERLPRQSLGRGAWLPNRYDGPRPPHLPGEPHRTTAEPGSSGRTEPAIRVARYQPRQLRTRARTTTGVRR